jgi:lipopolysaccharide biosynthesis protein
MKIDESKSLTETNFTIESPSSVALFVHWSKNDEISIHDLHVIDSLSNEFQKVLVISNSNTNKSSRIFKSNDLHKNVYYITRPNEGYDFGGYQFGMNLLRNFSQDITELLLLNNSVFLIKDSLSDLMARVRSTTADITGLTSSYERRPHIQSYFLFFGPRVIQDPAIWKWFQELNTISDKQITVESLEIPMMDELSRLGYEVSAVWNFAMLNKFMFSSLAANILSEFRRESGVTHRLQLMQKGQFHNPTHYMWAYLIELGFPFVKKDLLKSQELSNLGATKWKYFVESPGIKALIEDELSRSI